MNKKEFDIKDCPIGKKVHYSETYDPSCLFPIPRPWSREKTFSDVQDFEITKTIPGVDGFDYWNGYEFSWIDSKTKQRQLKFIQIVIPALSPFLIESKSLKLYLFSLANLEKNQEQIEKIIANDLERLTKTPIQVTIFDSHSPRFNTIHPHHGGIVLDDLEIECEKFDLDPSLLNTSAGVEYKEIKDSSKTNQHIFSIQAFKSNCLVTGKPDWASLKVALKGKDVDLKAVYQYLVSYRLHMGIHEQCVERILYDLYNTFRPISLLVQGHFTRRGGLDINPIRFYNWSFTQDETNNGIWKRHVRQ